MTTIQTTTSSSRPSSPSAGDTYFETDTKNVIIWDGSDWRAYTNDGLSLNYSSNNTYSAVFGGDDYAVATVSALNAVDAFSASFWFRFNSTNKIALSAGTDTSNRWNIHLKSNTVFSYSSSPDGTYPGPTHPEWTVDSMSSSEWYHVALIHDNTSVTLYLNGTSQGTKTGANSPNTSWRGTDVNIGRLGVGASYYWDGWIDEVSLFNRALTGSEVTNIYSSKNYLNPTALWRLNNDLTDSLGNYNLTNNGVTFDINNKAY